jgi:hypothetical protein
MRKRGYRPVNCSWQIKNDLISVENFVGLHAILVSAHAALRHRGGFLRRGERR